MIYPLKAYAGLSRRDDNLCRTMDDGLKIFDASCLGHFNTSAPDHPEDAALETTERITIKTQRARRTHKGL